jgi:hypothetical protein
LKTCDYCNLELPLERFYPGNRKCKNCRNEYTRNYYRNNPEARERRRESMKRCEENKPEQYAEMRRRAHLKRFWNITLEQYNEMLEKQNGVCAICKKPELSTRGRVKNQSLAVDHCHETGKIRELLCMDCNQTLGRFNDDPSWFVAASEYLMKHGKVVS